MQRTSLHMSDINPPLIFYWSHHSVIKPSSLLTGDSVYSQSSKQGHHARTRVTLVPNGLFSAILTCHLSAVTCNLVPPGLSLAVNNCYM